MFNIHCILVAANFYLTYILSHSSFNVLYLCIVTVRIFSVPTLPARFSSSREFLTYLPSRLRCEFSRLKVIGEGADGKVYKVLQSLDKNSPVLN